MSSVEQLRARAKDAACRHHYERAARLYEQLLRERPDDVPAMLSLAYLYFGVLLREWDAEPLYERAVTLAPTDCEALFWSAWNKIIFYGRAVDLVLARNRLERILSIDPDNGNGYTSHACRLLGSETFFSEVADEQRLELLRRAVELAPDLPHHHEDLASWYEEHGRLEDALSELRTALRHTTPYIEVEEDPQITYLQTVLEGRRATEGTLQALLKRIDAVRARLEAK